MGSERKFVQEGINTVQITEYFIKQLDRAGYGGMSISRTPMGTQITIFVEKPGIIIGKGGRTIRKLTTDVAELFNIDNPQIDVQEVKVPELNAQMMATRLANALERGIYFRQAGHNMLRRIMEAGALGCEIVTSGKLTGSRSRVQKFVAGNILHAGKPAEELVEEGFAIAIKKLGTIGCRVRIILPDTEIPGQFHTVPRTVEAPPETGGGETEEPEMEEVKAASEERAAGEVACEPDEERRMRGDVLEHKHKGYDYWHPVNRVHKREVEGAD